MSTIQRVSTRDLRIDLPAGAGSDAIHSNPQYSYAITRLHTSSGSGGGSGGGSDASTGVGLAFTLGGGNDLVCAAAAELAKSLVGREIEELMADLGPTTQRLADHPQLRWLGPHKGVVHLALASVVNACFDLWAKSRGLPLWALLLEVSPDLLVATLDLSYLEDVLTAQEARAILERERPGRDSRRGVIERGYPGYDTSVGWFNYSDAQIRENARRALDRGFTAMKLKVGSRDLARDIARAGIVREVVGPDVRLMVDANQQWTPPAAMAACRALAPLNPFWIEEPTHPDDILGHQTLARAIAPVPLAIGEHVPNRVIFKNYMQAQAAKFIQVDAVRVAGVSEFIVVSLLARKFGLSVVPHVGDMGQIHQHLVLFNHIALGLDRVFLEYIPHLRDHFVHPAQVVGGVYLTPQQPGSSSDML